MRITALVLLLLFLTVLSSQAAVLRRKRRKTAAATPASIEDYFKALDQKSLATGGVTTVIDGLDSIEHLQSYTTMMSFSTESPELSTPTAAPVATPAQSSCQDMSRSDVVLEVLSQVTPESELQNSVTPQGMAYLWILNMDTDVDPCTDPFVSQQRYALATFYYSTGGDSWTEKTNWLTDVSECDWFGVTCHEATKAVSVLKFGMYKCSLYW